MNEYDFLEFEKQFPWAVEQMEQLLASNDYFIRVKLNDGRIYEYNIEHKSIRKLPNDPDHLTERQYRIEFGRRLRDILSYKGLTQKDLSDITGIPQSTISHYIRGLTTPSSYMLDKIAKALNCSTDDFRYFNDTI